MEELTRWWVRRMAAVEQPVHEKLTFLWHNHFATSADKVRKAALMAAQNIKLRSLCLGDFEDLAYSMLTDAAMVLWLDGKGNEAGAPNENLSREFIELFALGHGNGYTEGDVREGARALTGWTVGADGEAKFVKGRHDADEKEVLGVSGHLDAKWFCRAVVGHRKSPGFIASRLWQQLASDQPAAEQTLSHLTKAFGSDRDLRALTIAVLADPEFLRSRETVVTPPIDWVIGLVRTLDVPLHDSKDVTRIEWFLRSLGQLPFYPPSVGGWPSGRAWLSTSAVGVRLSAALHAVEKGDISAVESAGKSERLDAVGYLIGVGEWSDASAKALTPLVTEPDALVVAAVNTPEYLTA